MPTFRYDYFLEVVQEYTSTQGTPVLWPSFELQYQLIFDMNNQWQQHPSVHEM